MSFYLGISLMFLFLGLKGFFSGSEIALVNADKIRLRRMAKDGHKGAKMVIKAFEHPDQLLSTTLIGTNISTIALTTIGTLLVVQLLGKQGEFWAFIVFAPVFLILGEIVPKSIFQEKSDELTPLIIYPIVLTSKILWPVILFFSRIARWAARLVGGRPDHGLFVSRKQLNAVLQVAEQSGSLGTLKKGELGRVLDFSENPVFKVMIPTDKMISYEKATPTKKIISQVIKSGHRRFPIYDKNKTNVTGIALISNWALLDPDLVDYPLGKLTQPALYLKATQPLDSALPLLLDRKDRMAIVVDDDHKAIGLVTFEDLISSAIGDINIPK